LLKRLADARQIAMAKDAKAARKEGRLGRGPVALDVLLLADNR